MSLVSNSSVLSPQQNDCIDVNYILSHYRDWTTFMEVRVIYSTLYALIFVIGIIGNGLLISSIIRRKRATVSNIFLINLGIFDLLLCITAVPITPVLAFMKSWTFGEFLCKLVPMSQAMSVLISSWCLCYIALDRYRSIVTPLKEPWSMRHAKILLLLAYITAMITSSPLYMMQVLQPMNISGVTLCGEFCGEFNWDEQDPSIKIVYGITLFCIQLVLPAIVMSFCYWKILQKASRISSESD
ncbi:hypothetical protein WR25_17353 [Diploscapter pachys]|uniref:G-protein coupled receptors family 1 profile domain-containing protein n=1 Tax=Diploscapter pachys TaxID=2018661 RepID=A0A2A2JN71_9BILA|nr:hypothetical protein WR25_17353 [Diploscapter pachys]